MTSQPPSSLYFVRGHDAKDYPVDAATLREWVRSGHVTADQQVYSSSAQLWTRARDLPELRDLFTPPPRKRRGLLLGFLGAGCLVLLVVIITAAIEGYRLGSEAVRRSSPKPAQTTTHAAATAPSKPSPTPAQRRVAAATELQRIFDASVLKGWELKFVPRGRSCDVLHVQGYVNLYPQQMEALGYGTLEYGRILPGGVNKYAFDAGFRDVVYTNEGNPRSKSFGASELTRNQVRNARRCTDEIAATIAATTEKPVIRSATPQFEPLSWTNAKVGLRLYDGSYRHEATIVSLDRPNDLMEVKYVKSGTVEPKQLSAVAQYWYVKPE